MVLGSKGITRRSRISKSEWASEVIFQVDTMKTRLEVVDIT